MAGIYIHIPFCRKACHYCDFHFSTSFGKKDEMVSAILDEISLQKNYLEDQIIDTVYFGGGTPSALPPDDIQKIITTLSREFTISPVAEITLESNPDDISAENLHQWKDSGINRLSIGVQSFQSHLLEGWNRSHTSDQARMAIELSQKAGFNNITADLIYGGPGLKDEDWISNIQTLTEYGIPHLSCYALTVEKGTALAHQIDKGKVKAPEDEQSNRQYAILQSIAEKKGYIQYEVSNFSLPGMESKHNTSYWSGKHYLGLGPSAHSYNGLSRQWNVAHNIRYIEAINQKQIPFEIEFLTPSQRYNEIVMTGLRTIQGIDQLRIKESGKEYEIHLEKAIQDASLKDKLYRNTSGNWTLKPEYYFFADGIASGLFF